MKSLYSKFVIFFVVTLFISGCLTGLGIVNNKTYGVSLNYSDGATDVPLDAVFEATFLQSVNATTVTAESFFILEGDTCDSSTAIAASVSCSSHTFCTLTPTGNLTAETNYRVCLTDSIRYTDSHVSEEYSIRITTRAGGGETVATPTFDPPAGAYNSAQAVSIACTTAGATIRYTTDGTDPRTSATAQNYTAPIVVNVTTTIMAVGIKTGMTTSDLATAIYTITHTGKTITVSDIFSFNLTLTWEEEEDDPPYEYAVYRSVLNNIRTVEEAEANGTLIKDYTADLTTYMAIGLVGPQKYYFNVIARGQSGNKVAYSSASATTKWGWGTGDAGRVNAIFTSGDIVYIGGDFTRIAKVLPGGQILDATTGETPDGVASPFIGGGTNVLSSVNVVIPDGAGGWYIGGEFTTVWGATRNNVARINSDGSLNDWNPNTDDIVRAIARNGDTVYIGGDFTTVGGLARNRIAAVDSDGNVTDWNPDADDVVRALAVSGDNIYAGGDFLSIGTTGGPHLAELDATTGLAIAWAPVMAVADSVYCIGIGNNTIYVGGNISNIGGLVRNNLAAINATTGDVLVPFDTTSPATVNTIVVTRDQTKVYVGGAGGFFKGVEGRNGIAELDAATGEIAAWDANLDGGVSGIALNEDESTVYIGGIFFNVGADARINLAAVDATTGLATDWDPNPDQSGLGIYSVAMNNDQVFVGGPFSIIGGTTRNNVAAINVNSGGITSWNPNADGIVRALAVSGSTVYAGGSFLNIGGQARNYLAALNTTNGDATAWTPLVDNTVHVLLFNSNSLYVGGEFTTIGGAFRDYIAEVNTTTNTVTAWDPSAGNIVYELALDSDTIYAGGDFLAIGGFARNRIAAIDIGTGVATAWDPGANGSVRSISIGDGVVYAGGGFTNIGGAARNYLAAIDEDGNATAWDPNVGGACFGPCVTSTTTTEDLIYVSGELTTIGGVARQSVGAVDLGTGLVNDWNPTFRTSDIGKVTIIDDTLYMIGDFLMLGTEPRTGIALFDSTTGELK